MKAVVKMTGDWHMDADMRHFNGKIVEVTQQNKSGLYRCVYEEGSMVYAGNIAKRDLQFINE